MCMCVCFVLTVRAHAFLMVAYCLVSLCVIHAVYVCLCVCMCVCARVYMQHALAICVACAGPKQVPTSAAPSTVSDLCVSQISQQAVHRACRPWRQVRPNPSPAIFFHLTSSPTP